MRMRMPTLMLLAVPAMLAAQTGGAPTPPPGRPALFTLDLQGTALGEIPDTLHVIGGVMTVVERNGQHMLKASTPSDFLITLPQVLPTDFTIELDVIPKACCAPDDIMLEGTPTRNRGVASVELTWQPERISAVGGGGDMYQSAMPEDLAASTPGNLTRLVVVIQGTTIKLYTNGRRLYTLEKQFARGRVLRVALGGADDGANAAYLAGLRIMAGVASPAIASNASGAGNLQALGQNQNPLPKVTPGDSTPPPPPPPPAPTPPPAPPPADTAGKQEVATNQQGLTANPGGAAVQGLFAKVDLQGNTSLSWQPVQGSWSYFAVRWLEGVYDCCTVSSSPNGMSALQWQAPPIDRPGTYRYRVYAYTPSGIATGETTVSFPPPLQGGAILNFGTTMPLGVLLYWGPLPNASAYRVYRQASPTQQGVLLGTISSSAPAVPGNEGLAAALDAELTVDVKTFQYWIQAVMADGSLSDPGPITPISQTNSGSMGPFGGPLVPPGLSATVGGTTTIAFSGQQVRGSLVTWTWDQDLSRLPVYRYFTTVEIGQPSGGAFGGYYWTPYRSDVIQVPGTPPVPYLKEGDVAGPPYTVGIPAGFAVRFCVSYFPSTAEQRAAPDAPGCVISITPP